MSLTSILDLEHRAYGFYVTIAAAVLTFITAIVYQVSYSSNQYYSAPVFVLLLLCLPALVVLVLAKLDGFAPAVITALSGAAALAFIYAMYWDVSVVLVGIDKQAFDPEFIVCAVLIVASFIVSEVSVYSKAKKNL